MLWQIIKPDLLFSPAGWENR